VTTPEKKSFGANQSSQKGVAVVIFFTALCLAALLAQDFKPWLQRSSRHAFLASTIKRGETWPDVARRLVAQGYQIGENASGGEVFVLLDSRKPYTVKLAEAVFGPFWKMTLLSMKVDADQTILTQL
jgi:hypothetical protein